MTERTKQDKLNLLQETVDYYSEDTSRRAVITDLHDEEEQSICKYYHKGNMCAVGRCLDDPKKYEKEFCGVNSIIRKYTQKAFKKEYQGFNVALWDKIQRLHDTPCNWDESGLTERGKFNVKFVEGLINKGEL